MTVQKLVAGELGSNTYVLKDPTSGTACVIDCGEYTSRLEAALEGLELRYILLTHGHFDHILGVPALKEKHPEAKVLIHAGDERCLTDERSNLLFGRASFVPFCADATVADGEELQFDGATIRVMHTPGHSEGSVCYLMEENKMIFTGDTLFHMSCGRTDFYGSDPQKMRESLKRLSGLDDDYKVFPGHNSTTSMAVEKQYNVFLRDL